MAVVMPVSIPGVKKALAGWPVSEKVVLLRANKYSPNNGRLLRGNDKLVGRGACIGSPCGPHNREGDTAHANLLEHHAHAAHD